MTTRKTTRTTTTASAPSGATVVRVGETVPEYVSTPAGPTAAQYAAASRLVESDAFRAAVGSQMIVDWSARAETQSRLLLLAVLERQFGVAQVGLSDRAARASDAPLRQVYTALPTGFTDEQRRQVRANAPERGARWNGYKHRGSGDCHYFGVWKYDNAACSVQNTSTIVFGFDVYEDARVLADMLLRLDPDTYGLSGLLRRGQSPDTQCTHPDIARPDRALAGRVTWRGYARMRWYRAACRALSAAHWATNVRPGFLYGIGRANAEGYAEGFENQRGEELWAWGPQPVKDRLVGWWRQVTDAGGELFLPLSTQSFFSASRDPGLDQPWVWGAEGREINAQTLQELRRGKRRRARRNLERAGFYQRQERFDQIRQGRVQASLSPADFTPLTALPEATSLEDIELAALFSVRGDGFLEGRRLLQRLPAGVQVPTGDGLVAHVQDWLRELVEVDIVKALLRANLGYLHYLQRFAEPRSITRFSPERQAALREAGAVTMMRTREGAVPVEAVLYVEAVQMTLEEVRAQEFKLRRMDVTYESMRVGSIAAGSAMLIAGLIAAKFSTVPFAGWIAAAIVLVLAALVVFFSWLFGARLQGCPKAPRPLCMRTVDDPECDFDISQSDRTIGVAWENLQTKGRKVGVDFVFPTTGFVVPPPASPEGPDWQFPELPPLLDEGWGWPAKLALGAGIGVALGLLLRGMR